MESLRWAATYPGCRGIIVSPTLVQLKKSILIEFQEQCRLSDGFLLNYNKTDMVAEFVNGSMLFFGQAGDPDSLRGPNLSYFGLDEGGQTNGEAFQILQGRIRDPRFPTGGWVTTTPRGKNWLYRTFQLKQDINEINLVDDYNYQLFKCSTEHNIYLSPDYVTSLRSAYTGAFARQELDGEFVSFEGVIWQGLSSKVGTPDLQVKRTVAGVDWGWTDPGVIVIVQQTVDGRLWIVHEEYETMRAIDNTSDSWISIAKKLQDKYRIEAFYCDPSEPSNIDAFRRANLNAVKGDNSIIPGITSVAAAQTNGMMISPDCPKLRAEIDAYCWAQDRLGKVKMDKPAEGNDHGPDALRYAVTSFQTATTARASLFTTRR